MTSSKIVGKNLNNIRGGTKENLEKSELVWKQTYDILSLENSEAGHTWQRIQQVGSLIDWYNIQVTWLTVKMSHINCFAQFYNHTFFKYINRVRRFSK